MKEHMAVDQYGHTYHALGAHPRKELLKRLCRQHAGKIYREKDGSTVHVGWVIGGLWLTIYETVPMERPSDKVPPA